MLIWNIPIMTCDIPIVTCDIFLNRLDLHRDNVRVGGIWPRDAQNNRQQNEAVKESEDDDQQKYFEESVKHVRLGVGEQDEGQESGDATIEDCRSNVPQSLLDSLLPWSVMLHKEPVSDVSAVVDAQPDGDDQVDAENSDWFKW